MEILDEIILLDNTGVEKIVPISEIQKGLGHINLKETKETILSLIKDGIVKKVGISKDGKSPVYSILLEENKELIHFITVLRENPDLLEIWLMLNLSIAFCHP